MCSSLPVTSRPSIFCHSCSAGTFLYTDNQRFETLHFMKSSNETLPHDQKDSRPCNVQKTSYNFFSQLEHIFISDTDTSCIPIRCRLVYVSSCTQLRREPAGDQDSEHDLSKGSCSGLFIDSQRAFQFDTSNSLSPSQRTRPGNQRARFRLVYAFASR